MAYIVLYGSNDYLGTIRPHLGDNSLQRAEGTRTPKVTAPYIFMFPCSIYLLFTVKEIPAVSAVDQLTTPAKNANRRIVWFVTNPKL